MLLQSPKSAINKPEVDFRTLRLYYRTHVVNTTSRESLFPSLSVVVLLKCMLIPSSHGYQTSEFGRPVALASGPGSVNGSLLSGISVDSNDSLPVTGPQFNLICPFHSYATSTLK